MQGAQKENFEFYQIFGGCIICFDTIPKEHVKNFIHIRDSRSLLQDGRRGDLEVEGRGRGERWVEKGILSRGLRGGVWERGWRR